MADKSKNVVLNFKMDGQVKYAETLREINAVMNTAAKEYKNHISAMGKDADATDKLRAEKKKLEIQMDGARKRTEMLRAQYEAMSKSTKTTTGQLIQMYGKLQDAERAESALQVSLERVTVGLTDEAQGARDAKDQLDKLKAESKLLESEQKNLSSAFKLQNEELGENASESEKLILAQRQLSKQMSLTDKTVANLEKQLEQSKKIYGENSVEANQMATKLNEARVSVNKFKKSLDGLEDSGKKAEKSMDGLGSGMQGLAGAAPAAAIGGLVTSMQEYNQVLARLKTNAATSGRDLKVVENAFTRITTITGEADAAGETLANLLASGFSDEQLSAVIDQVNGAYIRFSDTLKTEGIADGIQESLAVGEAVGPFAELLERSKVDIEQFNVQLKSMKAAGEGSTYVLQTLADLGFGKMTERYKENNPEVQKNAEANANLEKSMADLSIILTPLVADVAEFTTKLIEFANENPKLTAGIAAITAGAGALIGIVSVLAPIFTAVTVAVGATTISFGALMTTILPIIAIAAGVIAAIAGIILVVKNWGAITDWLAEKWSQFKVFLSELWIGIKETAAIVWESIKQFFIQWWPELLAIITGPIGLIVLLIVKNWDKIKSFTLSLFKSIGDFFSKFWASVKSTFSKIVSAVVDFVVDRFNNLKNNVSKIFNTIKSVASNIWSSIKSTFTKIVSAVVDFVISRFNNLKHNASRIMQAAKDLIVSPLESAKDKIQGIVERIKGFFLNMKLKIPKIDAPPLPHFDINGSFDLTPPSISVPTIDIDWRAKGAIYTKPTIFGSMGGRLQGAGEAGIEAALPLNDQTLGDIGKGIASNMKGVGGLIIQMVTPDNRVLAEMVVDDVTELQERNKRRYFNSKGR